MYLTGLKKCVIQKSFLSFSFNFLDNILRGIVDVLEETIEFFFLLSNIFLYISCFISILSTTASIIQSASET